MPHRLRTAVRPSHLRPRTVALAALGLTLALAGARESLARTRAASTDAASTDFRSSVDPSPRMRVVRDVAYGSDRDQRMDVYAPEHASGAPIIVMVHGGGWRRGDKSMGRVVENKVDRWVPRGFVVISVNYRMLPDADPVEQARDVARAIAAVQRRAAEWGGDRRKVILMGHSAGAHIAALLTASPRLLADAGATEPIGTVLLDSAALDVPQIMEAPHLPLYTNAFGRDPAFWRAASPYHQLEGATPPTLAVCSSRRMISCAQARRYVDRANSLGGRAQVHPEDRSHMEINNDLGEPGAYTDAVEAFLRTLDPAVARVLGS